ncbi:hydrolase [Pseudonocardia sp. CNS-139]|nr:hydrolase [Pseudonocardia sp. CNS-139]
MTNSHTIDVPGGRLYYEVRGSGPLLLVVGSPMGAAPFARLADALADDHTVVTLDPRGISASRLDDPGEDTTVDQRADDLVAILDDLGTESADVFGSSGGAVTGLSLVARYPGQVRTLVAHEPPLLELLPDAAERRAGIDDIVDTFHREGLGAAFGKFMAGFAAAGEENAPPPPPPGPPSEQDLADGARFLGHDMRATTRYLPDVAAVTAAPTRMVVAVGAESAGQPAHLGAVALAERLGTAAVEFPGGHGEFLGRPAEFADALRKALAG